MHKIWETIINNYSYMVLRYDTNMCFTSTLEERKQAQSYLRYNNKLANCKSPLPQFGSTELGRSVPAFSPRAELSKDEHTQRSVSSRQSCDASCILETRDVLSGFGKGFTSRAASSPWPSPPCPATLAAMPPLFQLGERGSRTWQQWGGPRVPQA